MTDKIVIDRAVAKQVLDALDHHVWGGTGSQLKSIRSARNSIRADLAQQDAQAVPQEPVAYIHRHGNHWEVAERPLVDDEKARGWTEEPLYTAPQPAAPTDLRAEYERGLEDAASIVENADTPDCGGWTTCEIAEEIRALKGKK